MSWADVEGKGSNEDKLGFFKLESGQTAVIRVADAEPRSKWTHWIQQAGRSVDCIGKDCPICNIIKESKQAGIKSPYSSSRKHVIHVLNKSTNKLELLEQGNEFFKQLLNYRKAIGDLQGFDIKIIRNGTKKNTTYTMIPMQPSDLTDAEKKLLEDKIDLEKDLTPTSAEKILELINGKTEETEPVEDEEIEV